MSHQEIEIRNLRLKDLSKIRKFYKSIDYETKKFFHPIFLNNSKKSIGYFIHRILFSISAINFIRYLLSKVNSRLAYHVFFMQDKSDQSLIGFSYLKNKQSNKNNRVASFGIVIHSNYQGKGYGKKLMDYTLNNAKKMKFKQIKLTVLEENFNAIEFYKKVGFSVLNTYEDKEYWDGVYYNDVEMIYYL